jgi:(p)ppGpp synthase/HD superfamily hydrolase
MNDEELIERARAIATDAHRGQVDKTGHPYITHPTRVSGRVRRLFPDAPAGVEAAALLHDVIEDTQVSGSALEAAGIPQEVVAAVDAVSKRSGEAEEDYFARIRGNPWAVMVKTADIEDNTDPARVAELDDATRTRLARKYERSRQLLAGE